MNPFLNNFIQSLGSGDVKRVNDVLAKAKVSSNQLDRVAQQLRDATFFDLNLTIPTTRPHSVARAEAFQNAFESFDERIEAIFTASNNISLLIDTYSSSLLSDIAAVESELNGLEKAIGNYAFLLSDAKSHDYAFLEPFSDLIGQELDNSYLSDRDKGSFTREQTVALDPQEGSISISNNLNTTYALTGKLVKTNYLPYVRSDTGVDNSTSETDKKGWRTSIASPSPIRSVLAEYDDLYVTPPSQYAGPLAIVDYILDSPATCDTIKIIPFSEFEVEITQIVIYHGQEGQEKQPMLDNPVTIDSPINLFFPMTSVSKFRVYLRQPLYTRILPNANRRQEDLQRESISVIVNYNQDKSSELNILFRDLISKITAIHGKNADTLKVSDIPLSKVKLTDVDSFEKFVMDIRYQKPSVIKTIDNGDRPDPRSTIGPIDKPQTSIINSEVEKLIHDMRKRLIGLGYYRFGSTSTSEADKSLEPKNGLQTKGGGRAEEKAPEPLLYGYSMGLRNVTIGSGTKGFKAVYVSKVLDAPSDLTDVKIRVSDFNYKVRNNQNETQPVTSVEYSVTNDSNPQIEDAWFPILSADQHSVLGERLLLDAQGKAYFRFPASFDAPLTVFKNNEPLRLNPTNDYISNGKQHITGVIIPQMMISGTDIFTCNYTPAYDASLVNFEALGGASPSLASAFSSDGVGETVSNAFGQLSAQLTRSPYVDSTKLSELDPILGLTGYQPIVLRFEDGSVALNFTDYVDGENLVLDANSDSYQYIHSGHTLVFNKPLVKAFRVYYKYIPCNVRFRVVLRCNYSTFISPKVDFVHLKAKTRSLI